MIDFTRFPSYTGRADPEVPVAMIATDRVIHRFFDTSAISPSGRYLALFRFPQETRPPQPGEAGDVVLVDLRTGVERTVARTCGWEMQLGANVQWGATDSDLFFNDVDLQDWSAYAVRYDMARDEAQRMTGSVFMASTDGRFLASYNLLASRWAQVGYGVVVPDASCPRNRGPVDTDGVDVTDLATGAVRRIATIRQIYDTAISSIAIPNPDDYEYYCFQVKWNPQATRLLTTVQWSPLGGGPRRRSVITMNADGSDIRCAITPEQWGRGGHHINWSPDGEHLTMNLDVDGVGQLDIIRVRYDGTGLCKLFTPGSGHPSLNPSGAPWFITDAYPDEGVTLGDGTSPLRLIHASNGFEAQVLDVFLSKAQGEFRIDAHPAWDRSGRYVVFNGFHNGTRTVFAADLAAKLGRRDDACAPHIQAAVN